MNPISGERSHNSFGYSLSTMGKKQDRRLTFWQNFIAGGIAGVGSRTFTSPLDVVKIIAQVGSKQHTGFIGTFKNIYRQEGMKGFWKGNGVACRICPLSGQFKSCLFLHLYLVSLSSAQTVQ